MITCTVPGCGKIREQHRALAHQFQGDEDAMLRKVAPQQVRTVVAADPVLRIALVRAGVITYDQLTEVEKELRAAGLLGGSDAGDRGSGGGDSGHRGQESS